MKMKKLLVCLFIMTINFMVYANVILIPNGRGGLYPIMTPNPTVSNSRGHVHHGKKVLVSESDTKEVVQFKSTVSNLKDIRLKGNYVVQTYTYEGCGHTVTSYDFIPKMVTYDSVTLQDVKSKRDIIESVMFVCSLAFIIISLLSLVWVLLSAIFDWNTLTCSIIVIILSLVLAMIFFVIYALL